MNLRIFWIVLTWLCVLAPARLAWAAPSLQKAIEQLEQGHFTESVQLYEQLIAKEPNNVKSRKEFMEALWRAKQYRQAESVAQDILKLKPSDEEAQEITQKFPVAIAREQIRQSRGDADKIRQEIVGAYRQNRMQRVIVLYRKLLKLTPDDPAPRQEFLGLLLTAKMWDQAAIQAREIVRRHPEEWLIWENLGDAETQLGRIREANAAYKRVMDEKRRSLRHDPSNTLARLELLRLDEKTENWSEGLRQTTTLLRHDPSDWRLWNRQGWLYEHILESDNAQRCFQKSLTLHPRQPGIWREIGIAHFEHKEFSEAIPAFEKAIKDPLVAPSVFPLLAQAYFSVRRFSESATLWSQAAAATKELTNYPVFQAQALFYAGEPQAAKRLLTPLAFVQKNRQAIDLLSDMEIVAGQSAEAIQLLETTLSGEDPDDKPRFLKLARLLAREGQNEKSLKLLESLLRTDPTSQSILMMKAALLSTLKRWPEAESTYEQIITINPFARDALVAYLDIAMNRKEWPLAEKLLAALTAADPADPMIVLQKARIAYARGNRGGAKHQLVRWLGENKQSGPVSLVYGGLTPYPQDPLLVDPYNTYPTNTFSDQLSALKHAGYVSLSAAELLSWQRGKMPLTDRSVFITLDGDGIETLREADPILKNLDYRAALFVVGANVQAVHTRYASWLDLRHYAETGRWDIEAQGDHSSDRLPIDVRGNTGMALISRQWFDDQRLETLLEMRARILADHQSIKRQIRDQLGRTPELYAYPNGNYGQAGDSNFSRAAPNVLELTGGEFPIAFADEARGYGAPTSDRRRLPRLAPSPHWSGAELVRHLQDERPEILVTRELLDYARWQNHPFEALSWLSRLREEKASPSVVMTEEAQLRWGLGDNTGGANLAQQVLGISASPEASQASDYWRKRQGPQWAPQVTFESDDRHRENLTVHQNFSFARDNARFSLRHLYGSYREGGAPRIEDNGVGAQWEQNLSLFQSLSAVIDGHFLSNGASNTFDASAQWHARWSDQWETTLEGGRALYETATALRAGITDRHGTVNGSYRFNELWSALGSARGSVLSDRNRRMTSTFEVSRSFWTDSPWSAIYHFTFDDMAHERPEYYSPRRVQLHQLGAQCSLESSGQTHLYARYLPGVGEEKGTALHFVQNADLGLTWAMDEFTTLQPSFSLGATPTYRSQTYSLSFSHFFR